MIQWFNESNNRTIIVSQVSSRDIALVPRSQLDDPAQPSTTTSRADMGHRFHPPRTPSDLDSAVDLDTGHSYQGKPLGNHPGTGRMPKNNARE